MSDGQLERPVPGEVWLEDASDMPIIITKITYQRVGFIKPSPGGNGNDDPGWRESYMGDSVFTSDRYTRLWPRATRRAALDDKRDGER